MFSTLESTWDQSAHRGWTTLVSLTVQAAGLSLLLLIPLFVIQGPPKLQWFNGPILTPPAAAPPAGPRPAHSTNTNMRNEGLVGPSSIPLTIANLNETHIEAAPDLDADGVTGGTNTGRSGVRDSIGTVAVTPPASPAPTHHLKLSHWAEGNLIYRVQPSYPPLARAARVQGAVQLQAVISRTGTIESLVVVSGHPMLSKAALEAVRQWRYRPYLLNNEPVEVETEITVNFVLSGS
jgi:periplasmic protein TonB